MLENVQCITNNFPWDWFLFLLIPLLLLWWYHIYMVRKLLDQKQIIINEDKLVKRIVDKVVEKNNLFIRDIEETIVSSISKSENMIVSNVVDSKSEIIEKISLLDLQRLLTEITVLIKNTEINTLTQLESCKCKYDFVESSKMESVQTYKFVPYVSIKDDLTRIEGIGRSIEGLLNKAGIYTYYQLAITDPKEIDVIIDKAGKNFNTAVPYYWPKQATWLRDRNEVELKKWQIEYKHGKEKFKKDINDSITYKLKFDNNKKYYISKISYTYGHKLKI